jgi:hypothetical protein
MRLLVASALGAVVSALLLFSSPQTAYAYPWMNRHEYPNCASCHADPSGGGLLTQYGRAQSELLLSSRYGSAAEEEEPGPFKDFAFGAFEFPDQVLLGAWVRNGYMWNRADESLVDHRFLQMRADVAAQVKVGAFRANGTIGVASRDSQPLSQNAALTSGDGANLVSREHWLGVDLFDEAVLVRAGRIALPFGLRITEHTAWVRAETRTDINQDQQHGIAVALNTSQVRAEVMGVVGNLQVRPDSFRDRGIAAYAELHATQGIDLGISTLVLRAETDLAERAELVRQAHGAFARVAPLRMLVLLAEANVLVTSRTDQGTELGGVGLLQADLEPWQGLHVVATGEALRRPQRDSQTGYGAWGGIAWFFLPHFDVRGDVIQRTGQGGPSTTTYLLQLHGYL